METQTTAKACIFTICSRNYLHYARVLMESARLHSPGVDRYVFLCDTNTDLAPIDPELLAIIDMDKLRIDRLDEMISKYSVMELNTAVKPSVFRYLYDIGGYEKVVYFDPDIRIYDDMTALMELLDHHAIVLTPHITAPIEDQRHPSEVTFLQCGTYNLGFMGTSRSATTDALLDWWAKRLFDGCGVDLPQGLFTDQKWINLVPGFFSDVFICRNAGWNVAYWNLMHRSVEDRNGTIHINDHRLFFFHFSGVTADGKTFSKHQDRYTSGNLHPVVAKLALDYSAALRVNGADEYGKMSYGYGRFPSGHAIPDFMRRIYRDNKSLASQLGPFSSPRGEDKWMEFALEIPRGFELINRAALALYEMRIDLSNAFPDLMLGHEVPYATWFADNGATQPDMPERFVQPVKQRLASRSGSPLSAGSGIKFGVGSLRLWAYRAVYQLAWRMQRIVYPLTTQATRRRIHEFLANLAYGRKTTIKQVSARLPQQATAGMNVVGYLKAESGVGRAAQLTLRAAQAGAIPVAMTNFDLGCASRQEGCLPTNIPEGSPHRINLFHINADQMPVVHSQLGSGMFEHRYNIGFWYWEMPEFPDEWTAAFDYLDEIWVASTYCQQSISRKSPVPVVVMPPGIIAEPDERYDRRYFGLPNDCFVFLTMADGLSFLERKNPLAVVEAFRRAFSGPGNKVKLVIKTVNASRSGEEARKLLEAVRGDPAIIVLDRYMSRAEVDSLIMATDTYVSLHRSEGFGLPLAEAMYLGKPVVATGWSANIDFMRAHNAYMVDYSLTQLSCDYGPYRAGMHWAEPDLAEAAHYMRIISERGSDVKRRAERAAADIRQLYSPERAGLIMKQRLESIYQSLTIASGAISR